MFDEAFAKQLEETLTSGNGARPILDEIRKRVDDLTFIHVPSVAERKGELDKQGTRLWNLALQLNHKDSETACLGLPLSLHHLFATAYPLKYECSAIY